MAVVKPRTAIVIVLVVLAAAVFSLVLLPRWQSTKANPSQQSDQSSPKPLVESLANIDKLAADKEAMWNPNAQGQPEATKSVVSPPTRVNSQKPIVGPSSSAESFELKNPEPGKPGEAEDDGQRLLRKLKAISMNSQPQRPEGLEKTPNAVKYERLRSLLGRMHEPSMEAQVDLRNEKPRLSKVLEKEALERLVKEHNDEDGVRPVRHEVDKGQEREKFENDNRQERERLGINKGQGRVRQLNLDGQVDTNLNRNIMMPDLSPRAGSSVNTAMGNPSSYHHKEPTKATTPVLTTTISTTSPPLTTVSSTPPPPPTRNPVKDLPSLKRGSVEIRPERLPPPAHSSDIYYSLLTAPVYHNLRFSLQYLTWLQTVDPKQVSLLNTSYTSN